MCLDASGDLHIGAGRWVRGSHRHCDNRRRWNRDGEHVVDNAIAPRFGGHRAPRADRATRSARADHPGLAARFSLDRAEPLTTGSGVRDRTRPRRPPSLPTCLSDLEGDAPGAITSVTPGGGWFSFETTRGEPCSRLTPRPGWSKAPGNGGTGSAVHVAGRASSRPLFGDQLWSGDGLLVGGSIPGGQISGIPGGPLIGTGMATDADRRQRVQRHLVLRQELHAERCQRAVRHAGQRSLLLHLSRYRNALRAARQAHHAAGGDWTKLHRPVHRHAPAERMSLQFRSIPRAF